MATLLSRGLTQEELAQRLGVTRPTVTQYESGRREPDNVTILKALAEALGVSVDWLTGMSEGSGAQQQPPDPDPQVRAILRSMNGLGEAERAEILEYIAWKRAQKRRKDADQADNPVTPEGGPRP